MKKSLKKVLSLLMVALLLVTSVPNMTFAEQTTGTLKVSASGIYVNDAIVTGLPYPYANDTYNAFCADKEDGINPGTLYNATFSSFTSSNRVAYLINSNITTDEKVMQQLIWRILNGGYSQPGNLKDTADALWQDYFQVTETYYGKFDLLHLFPQTRLTDKPDSSFPAINDPSYTNTIFYANTGRNVQPILVVAQTKFEVKFLDKDGNVLKTEIVNKFSPATAPTAPEVIGYAFKNWDIPFSSVTSNLVVKAQYDKLNLVRFINHDGTVLKTEYVANGLPATAPTEDPTKTGHHFTGWTPAYGNITSDLDVNANFAINTYTVTFLDKNDATIGTPVVVDYDGSVTPPTAPTVTGFDFVEWLGTYTNVKENSIVHSVYKVKTFKVTFYDHTGIVIGEPQTVEYGQLATYPDVPAVEGKTNGAWDTARSPVYSNLEIKPIYDTVTLNVTFHAKDGSAFVTRVVPYDTGATAPTLPSVHGFTFTGWDKEFNKVTSDLDVYPNYTENPKGTVTVKHTFIGDSTRDGEVVLTGYYDDTFNAVPVAHDGYTYVSEGLLTGNYSEVPKTVQFTYSAIPAPTGKVFVKHENPNGSTYAEGSLLQGGYETPYTATPLSTTTHNVSLKTGSAPATGIFTADDITVTFVYTLKAPEVPSTTEAPATTEAPQATTEAPVTTQPATEVLTDEDVAEGGAIISDFDSYIDETATTEAVEELEIETEATPLADALPQTGQLPVELFYGVGGLITAAGVFLKKKN